jgi:hypothetical protein
MSDGVKEIYPAQGRPDTVKRGPDLPSSSYTTSWLTACSGEKSCRLSERLRCVV